MSKEKFFDGYFSHYYRDGYNGWMMNVKVSHKERFKTAIREMKRYKKTITNSLEIACATGDFTEYIIKGYPELVKLHCIDISDEAIRICKDRFKNEKICFERMELPKLDYDEYSFDVIWCMDVIYYLGIREQYETVERINYMLDKDGMAFFMIPYNLRNCSILRRCIKKNMEIVKEEYKYNGLWRTCTVFFEQRYNKAKNRGGIIGKCLPWMYVILMKSTLLMKIVYVFNVLLFKNHISHYVILAKKKKLCEEN